MKVILSVTAGPMKGEIKEFEEADIFLIGRSNDCHFHLSKDRFLSRHHCILEINPPYLTLIDMGSLNGSFVNGIKYGGRGKGIKPEDATHSENIELKDKDIMKLGDTEIFVKIEKPAICVDCDLAIPEEEKKISEFVGGSYLCKKCREKAEEKNKLTISAPNKAKKKLKKDNKSKAKKIEFGDLTEIILKNKKKKYKAEYDISAIVEDFAKMIFIEEIKTKDAEYSEFMGYKIIKMIGKGGFGAVYLAEHYESGKKVALKTMLQTQTPDVLKVRLFEREIENLKSLKHPNIVTIIDTGNYNGIYYFAMEIMDVGSVWDLMVNGRNKISINDAIPIMIQSLEGLAFAHKKEFVHRDIKPPNILLSGEQGKWIAKISDFGLAKNFTKAGMTKRTITITGSFCGSPPYMAPEHITNYRYVNPVTDIFEIAATFYHMLTGQTVWDISCGVDPYKVILQGKIKPIRAVERNISESVAEVIDKALSRDTGYRYKDGGEMLKAMENIV